MIIFIILYSHRCNHSKYCQSIKFHFLETQLFEYRFSINSLELSLNERNKLSVQRVSGKKEKFILALYVKKVVRDFLVFFFFFEMYLVLLCANFFMDRFMRPFLRINISFIIIVILRYLNNFQSARLFLRNEIFSTL